MPTTISRTAYNLLVDSDGSPTSGSPWDKAAIETVLLSPIDALLANPLHLTGPLGVGIASQTDSTLMVARNAGTTGHRAAQIGMLVESGTGGIHTGLVVSTTTSTSSTWTPGTGSQLFAAAFEATTRRASTSEATVMGLNVQARALLGSTGGFTEITACELDVTSEIADCKFRCGLLVSAAPMPGATPPQNQPATGSDFAYGIAAKEFGAPFKRGFYIYDAPGASTIFPIRDDGTIFEAIPDSSATVAHGIVLSPSTLTITGNAFQSANFRVKGTGKATVGSNADPIGTLDIAAASGDSELVNYRSSGEMLRIRTVAGFIDMGSFTNHPVRLYANSTEWVRLTVDGGLGLKDGITAPATATGFACLYIDTADGDLKVKFGDGTVKTIATDT